MLDIDVPEGHCSLQELQKAYFPLSATRRSRIANGGLHFFFTYPNDGHIYKNALRLHGLTGIDLWVEGSYVVLPPSKLYGRLSYIWSNPKTPIAPLPLWLKEMILEAQRQRGEIPQGLRFARRPGE